MPSFSDFDLDGDGVISEAEFNKGHAKRMSEMAAQGHQMKHAGDAPGFSGIDNNENGEISKDEFATHTSGSIDSFVDSWFSDETQQVLAALVAQLNSRK